MQSISILKKRGYKVRVFSIKTNKQFDSRPMPEIEYLFPIYSKRILNLSIYLLFILRTWFKGLFYNPDVIIAVDFKAVLPSLLLAKFISKPLVYHCLDLGLKEEIYGLQRILLRFERRFATYMDLVIFPEENRFRIFQTETERIKKHLIVFNALSRNYLPAKDSSLKELLRKKGYRFKHIVFRHGGIGEDQCIIESILALEFLPDDTVLVLAGYSDDAFISKVKSLIKERNLEKRVIILGSLPRDEILKFLPSVDIGLAVYKPTSINKKFYSTGSTKIGEYIALGVPAVVNDNKVMRELNKKVGSFVFADPNSPESIANAIKEVIFSPEKRKKLRKNAKSAFDTFYNFEHQFTPVLKEIEKWVGK